MFFAAAFVLDLEVYEPGVAACVFFGGSEFLVHGVALDGAFALGDGVEGVEVGAESAAAHGAFFLDAIPALGEDGGVAFAGEEFDADFGARLLPFAVGEFCFERGEFSFGRADERGGGRGIGRLVDGRESTQSLRLSRL